MGASLANKNLLAKKIFTNVDTHISLLISLDLFLVDCVVIFDQINYYRVIGFDIRKFKIGKRKQKEM